MKRDLNREAKRSPAKPGDIDVEDTIGRRAYELYEERGCRDGHELQDWVEAEAEVLHPKDLAKAG